MKYHSEHPKEETQQKAEQKDIKGDATATIVNNPTINITNLTVSNYLVGDEFKVVAQKFVSEVDQNVPSLSPEIYDPALSATEVDEWDKTGGIFTILKTQEGAIDTISVLSITDREKKELVNYSALFDAFEKLASYEKRENNYKTLLLNAIRVKCREDIIDALPDGSDEIADKTEEVGRQKNAIETQLGADAKKVYNMLMSTDLSEFVCKDWNKFKTECVSEAEAITQFGIYWHRRLQKHPNKVFISRYQCQADDDADNVAEVVKIMRDYLVMKKAVELFSRGKQLNKLARDAIVELKKEFAESYLINEVPGRIAKVKTLKHVFFPREVFQGT